MRPTPPERLRELADAFDPAKHYPGAFVQGMLRTVAELFEAEATCPECGNDRGHHHALCGLDPSPISARED